MEVLYPHCAGLDVHQQTLVACARIVSEEGVAQHVETFETTPQGLERLRDGLAAYGCTHVAMESTGVYWKPVFGTCSRGASPSGWPTPLTSATSQAARAM